MYSAFIVGYIIKMVFGSKNKSKDNNKKKENGKKGKILTIHKHKDNI